MTCSWRDHVLVGADADEITDDDFLLAREIDGIRWLRCLRCDGWFQFPIPSRPTGGPMPSREEIELPVRGPLLRDHYVLRLIAVDRAIHVIVLGALAVILFTFARI